jgi:5-methylcytosine-specific restriction protein A
MVDHIVPLRAGGARLEVGNLQALCNRCHNRKTAGDTRKYQGRGEGY